VTAANRQHLWKCSGVIRDLPIWQNALSMTSQVTHMLCSVPQGSVMGSLLFLLYTADLAELAARFGVTLHAYAHDNQFSYISAVKLMTQIYLLQLLSAVWQQSATGCPPTASNSTWRKRSGCGRALGATSIDCQRVHGDWHWETTWSTSLMLCEFLEWSSRQIWVWTNMLLPSALSAFSSCVSCTEFDGHSMLSLWGC